jgi:YegS/Rv2252/BmrU family lipid kinase
MKSKGRLVSKAKELKIPIEWTKKAGDLQLLTQKAISEGATRIIVAGGDGSFLEAANVLRGTNIALGFVPGGTGNDLRRTLGTPENPVEALRFAASGEVKKMDVGLARFETPSGKDERIFLNIAEVGFGAEVVVRMNRVGRLAGSKLAYPLSILSCLLSYRRRPVELQWGNNKQKVSELTNLVIANARYFGRGLQPAPKASIEDGLLDILVIEGLSAFKIATKFPSLKDGPPPGEPGMSEFQTPEIRVTGPSSVGVEADGETLGHLPASFTVLPNELAVIRNTRS